MSETEITEKGYSIDKWSIKKDGTTIAKVTSHEFELQNNKLVKELSITVMSIAQTSDIEDIIKFIHTKYPKLKIEVNYDSLIDYE
jgi:hypothetical protein